MDFLTTLYNVFLKCYFQAFAKAFLWASFLVKKLTAIIPANTAEINKYSKSSFKTSNIFDGNTRVKNKSETKRKEPHHITGFTCTSLSFCKSTPSKRRDIHEMCVSVNVPQTALTKAIAENEWRRLEASRCRVDATNVVNTLIIVDLHLKRSR